MRVNELFAQHQLANQIGERFGFDRQSRLAGLRGKGQIHAEGTGLPIQQGLADHPGVMELEQHLLGKNPALKRAQPPPQILDQLSDFQR